MARKACVNCNTTGGCLQAREDVSMVASCLMHTVDNIGVNNRDGVLGGQVHGGGHQIADSQRVKQADRYVFLGAQLAQALAQCRDRIRAKDFAHVAADAFKFEVKKRRQVFIQWRQVNHLAALHHFSDGQQAL